MIISVQKAAKKSGLSPDEIFSIASNGVEYLEILIKVYPGDTTDQELDKCGIGFMAIPHYRFGPTFEYHRKYAIIHSLWVAEQHYTRDDYRKELGLIGHWNFYTREKELKKPIKLLITNVRKTFVNYLHLQGFLEKEKLRLAKIGL